MLREKDIERYLVKKIKEAGGMAYKWVSPGNTGVPDRIIILPTNFIMFAELKAPGKVLRPDQLNQHQRLKSLGMVVWVIDSKEKVDKLMKIYKLTQTFFASNEGDINDIQSS